MGFGLWVWPSKFFLAFEGFFWDIWCLTSPVVCKNHMSDQYFMPNRFCCWYSIPVHRVSEGKTSYFTLFQLASVVLKSHKLHVYILPLFVNCVVCFSNLCDFISSLVGNSTTHISHKNLGIWSWCSLSKWTSNAAHSDQKFSYFRVLPKFKSLRPF